MTRILLKSLVTICFWWLINYIPCVLAQYTSNVTADGRLNIKVNGTMTRDEAGSVVRDLQAHNLSKLHIYCEPLRTSGFITQGGTIDAILTPEVLQIIFGAIGPTTILTDLWIRNTDIGDVGANIVADFVKSKPLFVTLDLARDSIGPVGLKSLLDALSNRNKTVDRLHLEFNKLGDDGATILANFLRTNIGVRGVSLWKNNISQSGAKAIRDALLPNITMLWFNIDVDENLNSDFELLLKRNNLIDQLRHNRIKLIVDASLPLYMRYFAGEKELFPHGIFTPLERQQVVLENYEAATVFYNTLMYGSKSEIEEKYYPNLSAAEIELINNIRATQNQIIERLQLGYRLTIKIV